MLIGEYRHTLDSKKRLSLPATLRKSVGKKVVITRGLDSCLFLFPQESWERVVAKLESLPLGSGQARGVSRFILAGAAETEIDSAGRVLIPDFLKEFAHLKAKVVVTGASNRIEIWDEKVWDEYRLLMEKEAGTMAQALSDVGRF